MSEQEPAERPDPPRLYKYRSMEPDAREFTERIFRGNELWFAQTSTFNDPFDCNHTIDVDRNSEEWRATLEHFERRFSELILAGPALFGGWLMDKFARALEEKGKAGPLVEKMKVTPEQSLAWARTVAKRGEVTVGGRRVTELADPTPGEEDANASLQRLNSLLGDAVEEARQAVDRRFGVLSLAERADTILMWSHYADEHAGICIELDVESHGGALPNLHRVEYSEESPVIAKRFGNLLMNLQGRDEKAIGNVVLSSIADPDLEGRWSDPDIRRWFLTKAIAWQYEHEWRSIKEGPGKLRVPAATISGVILGCKASAEVEETVRGWIKRRRRKVHLYRAVRRKGAFALDLEPLG